MAPIELQRFRAFFVAAYQKMGAQVLIPTKVLVIAAHFLVVAEGTVRLEIEIL